MVATPVPSSVGLAGTSTPVALQSGALIDGVWYPATGLRSTGQSSNPPSNYTQAAPAPPHLNFTFDTIGQVIPLTLGHVRLNLKIIWVRGVDGTSTDMSTGVKEPDNWLHLTAAAVTGDRTLVFDSVPDWVVAGMTVAGVNFDRAVSVADGTVVSGIYESTITISKPLIADMAVGDIIGIQAVGEVAPLTGGAPGEVTSFPTTGSTGVGTPVPTVTFAAALCEPIDPTELGELAAIFDGANQVYSLDDGGLVLPAGWTLATQQQLATALNGAVIFPGTEGQLPSPLIVADRGADATPAFRGLRYIVIEEYPIVGGVGGSGSALPRLSIVWRRSNTLTRKPTSNNVIAVQFAAGSG